MCKLRRDMTCWMCPECLQWGKTPWSDAWSACSIWQRNSSPHFYRGVQIPHKRKPREHLNIKRQNPTAHITTQSRVSHWESIDSFRNMFAKGLLSSPPSIRFDMNMIAQNCNSFWKCFTLSIWCLTYRRNDSPYREITVREICIFVHKH